MKKMIGLGTGRCGTVTLTELINRQRDFFATHETFHSIASWKFNNKYFNALENYIVRGGSDISLYNLPYVERLLSIFSGLKFVCLKRDKEATVNSYIKKTGTTPAGGPRNHWTNKNSRYWSEYPWREDSIWDKCYPKFDLPKVEAINAYWDYYYTEADRLESLYPNTFKVYDMEMVLNNKEYQSELLSFTGVLEKDKRFLLKEKLNSG